MPYRLEVQDGRIQRTLDVRAPVLTVGARADSGLRLDTEGVARRHAEIRQIGSRLVVQGVASKPSLRIAGRNVRRALLRVGDTVDVAGARIRVAEIEPFLGPLPPRRSRSGRTRRFGPAAFSVAAHAVLLVFLQGWVLFAGAPPPDAVHFETASLDPPAELAPDPAPEPVEEPVDLVPREPEEVELLPVETELPEIPLAADDPRLQPPPKAPTAAAPPAEPAPAPAPTVGLGGVPDVVNRGFGKDGADGANRSAAGLLESDDGAAAVLRGVRSRASEERVWVVRGDYDSAEKVLHQLAVSHAVLGKDALETHEIPASVRVLIFNCTGRPLSPEAQARVAEWVREGGWLLTTDWGVERVVERGMPGTLTPLRVNERPVLTRDETVDVHPTTDRGLSAGVPQDPGSRWWLEDSSVPFTVAPGIGAEILVRSDDLERRHGHPASGVAATFPWGRGRVLHLLGHVYQQEGNLRGAVLVQRITLNFLSAALAR